METTLQIDDDVLRDLEARACREKIALGELVNQMLREGLAAQPPANGPAAQPFRLRTYSMGKPLAHLDKALQLAAELEDEELAKKLAQGK